MPELPDVSVYVEALQARVVGHQLVRAMVKSPFLLRSTAPPISATYRPNGPRSSPRRQADRDRRRRRPVARVASHDRGPAALESYRAKTRRPQHPRRLRVRQRMAVAYRSGHAAPRRAPRRRRRSRSASSERRRYRAARREPRRVHRRAALRESHVEALAHRPAHLQRHRQFIFRRDSASRTTLARRHVAETECRGNRAALRCDARDAGRMDRSIARRRQRRVSRKGHRVSPRDGRPRPLSPAMPAMRHQGPAHPLRQQRNQLLREVPDGRPPARRPRALAPDARGLAAHRRRTRSDEKAMSVA